MTDKKNMKEFKFNGFKFYFEDGELKIEFKDEIRVDGNIPFNVYVEAIKKRYEILDNFFGNSERAEVINKALLENRGPQGLPHLYFDSDEVPFVEYYYDETDDCLHAECVDVPMHYELEEIANELIDKILKKLQQKVLEQYKQDGIDLKMRED